ncbi:MAG: TadG family pilus assembly protein, partial [Nitrospirota bacterium]
MWKNPRSSVVSPFLNQRGIAAINGVFMGLTMAIMAGVAIDVGHALLTQNELHNASDAAALAAARQLGVTYLAMPIAQQQDLNRSLTSNEQSQVNAQATAAAFANSASNISNLSLSQGDIEYGTWDFNGKTFTPTVTRPNAIRATARRDGAANGPITTFFGGILGVNTMSLATSSIAALGTSGGPTPPGVADVPFAISSNWFNGVANCNGGIQFSPTGVNGCAGWHVFDQNPANANKLRNTIDGLQDGSYQSPALTPGLTHYTFTGGEVASAFPNLIDLWNTKKEWNTETGRDEWAINLPVYEASSSSSCSNPSGSITIVGYAKAVVTNVKKKDIQA